MGQKSRIVVEVGGRRKNSELFSSYQMGDHKTKIEIIDVQHCKMQSSLMSNWVFTFSKLLDINFLKWIGFNEISQQFAFTKLKSFFTLPPLKPFCLSKVFWFEQSHT